MRSRGRGRYRPLVTSSRILAASLLLFACNKDKTETPEPAPAAEPAPEEAVAEEQHFDVSQDRSGALARAAAVLEAEGIDNPDLQVMSHHTEKLPSAAVVCQHILEVQGATGGIKDCVEDLEHHIADLGPEIWALAAQCFVNSTTEPQLDACVAAEKEAEKLLEHEPHGDGLNEEECTGLFDKFKALTVADRKEDGAHAGQILDTVKDNVIRSCMAHGTKAELECANKSATLHELTECTEVL